MKARSYIRFEGNNFCWMLRKSKRKSDAIDDFLRAKKPDNNRNVGLGPEHDWSTRRHPNG
jgi:hypothetical protein